MAEALSAKLFLNPCVFFLFACSTIFLISDKFNEPGETYATNVMGTLHILEAIRSIKSVRSAVVITTDKCYDNKEWEWGYRENEPMGGHDLYSSSKGCAELLIASYRDSYFPPQYYEQHQTAIASVRVGNVIGGGDWAEDRLIPDIIRAIENNETVQIRNPNAIRPWQHVLEPLAGYLQLAEKLSVDGIKYAQAWNFGPNEEDAKSVGWIVKEIAKIWGEGAKWEIDEGEHPHEANYLKLDCSKAKTHLGWQPQWNLKITLNQIIKWHKSHSNGDIMRDICMEQINEYEKTAGDNLIFLS